MENSVLKRIVEQQGLEFMGRNGDIVTVQTPDLARVSFICEAFNGRNYCRITLVRQMKWVEEDGIKKTVLYRTYGGQRYFTKFVSTISQLNGAIYLAVKEATPC